MRVSVHDQSLFDAIQPIMLTIAEAIAFKFGSFAGIFEVRDACITLGNVRAVQTFACLTVLVIFASAAVTTIPIATRVVAAQKTGWEER